MICCHMFTEVLVPEGHVVMVFGFLRRGGSYDLHLDKLLCDHVQGQLTLRIRFTFQTLRDQGVPPVRRTFSAPLGGDE